MINSRFPSLAEARDQYIKLENEENRGFEQSAKDYTSENTIGLLSNAEIFDTNAMTQEEKAEMYNRH